MFIEVFHLHQVLEAVVDLGALIKIQAPGQ
jgi:hypothetical protein